MDGNACKADAMEEFEFIESRDLPFEPMKSRGELPHLYKEGATYFVTFRLVDAVVPGGRTHEAAHHNSARSYADVSDQGAIEIAKRYEPPLKRGCCLLQQPENAELVQNALRHFHGSRYYLSAWCVMPNHVHAIVTPSAKYQLDQVMHSWKSFTAHEISRRLRRQEPIWERESFDHLIRSVEYFDAFVRYVENNPVMAGLCDKPAEWPWSSARMRDNS